MASKVDFWDRHGDPRVKDFFLMSKPWPVLTIIGVYLFIIKVIGPKLMEKRKPFNMKRVMVVYNLIQVLWNVWLFNGFLFLGWLEFKIICQPRGTGNPVLLNYGYWFFILKLSEFCDTFIFIMRKKFNQVSKLHVIHHTILPFSGLKND
jgi:elongation of very long chain fatty acids protein 7